MKMDRTRGHYAEQNKTGAGREILHAISDIQKLTKNSDLTNRRSIMDWEGDQEEKGEKKEGR
jgi:hypothetical protein